MDGGAYVDFPCEIRGNALGPVLVFLAGFPDNPVSYAQISHIEGISISMLFMFSVVSMAPEDY